MKAKRNILLAATLMAGLIPVQATAAVALATGELLTNGSFEAGNLTGWTAEATVPSGSFAALQQASVHPSDATGIAPAPSNGTWLAMASQAGVGTQALWQEFTIPANALNPTLSFDWQFSEGALVNSPSDLGRVDITAAGATALTAANGVLATLVNHNGSLLAQATWAHVTFDLTPYIGQTIRLRALATATFTQARLLIDNVSVNSGVLAGNNSGGGILQIISATAGTSIVPGSMTTAPLVNPPAGTFPFDKISYQVNTPVGGTATTRLVFPTALPAGFQVYKVDVAGNYTAIPAAQYVQVNATTIDLALTDGGPFDLDGAANGVIVDPVAIGAPVAAAPVAAAPVAGGGCTMSTASNDPTLLLLLLLAGGYLLRSWRKSSGTVEA